MLSRPSFTLGPSSGRIKRGEHSAAPARSDGKSPTLNCIAGMCGRATYKLIWEEIVALYRRTLSQPAVNTRARYNVCPTTTIDTIVGPDDKRELVVLRCTEGCDRHRGRCGGKAPLWVNRVILGALADVGYAPDNQQTGVSQCLLRSSTAAPSGHGNGSYAPDGPTDRCISSASVSRCRFASSCSH